MAYSQSSAAPTVLKTLQGKVSHFIDEEKHDYPRQLEQAKVFTNRVKETALSRAQMLKDQVGSWEQSHPQQMKQLRDVEASANRTFENGKKEVQDRLHSTATNTAHSLSTHEQCHGTQRKALVYGYSTMRHVGRAHEELREEAGTAEGDAARRSRY